MNRDDILKKLSDNGFEIKENIIINDNDETVTCRIDGKQYKRIYGRVLSRFGLYSDEYKILFPNAPLGTQDDRKNTSKSCGLYMREPYYRQLYSEKFMGEKNPNHTAKTTEQERKERSPFSVEFYKKHDIGKTREELYDDIKKIAVYNTQPQYYINRGFSAEEAKKMVSDRQRTFSYETCIAKYGLEEGERIFTERQELWQESLKPHKIGYSMVSQKVFNILLNNYDQTELIDVFYATKNNEISLRNTNGGIYLYDFTDTKRMKMIEFNGDLYHANPNIYEATDNPNPYHPEYTAEEIWNKDDNKRIVANNNGYDLHIVWESDWIDNPDKCIRECLEFLGIK